MGRGVLSSSPRTGSVDSRNRPEKYDRKSRRSHWWNDPVSQIETPPALLAA